MNNMQPMESSSFRIGATPCDRDGTIMLRPWHPAGPVMIRVPGRAGGASIRRFCRGQSSPAAHRHVMMNPFTVHQFRLPAGIFVMVAPAKARQWLPRLLALAMFLLG